MRQSGDRTDAVQEQDDASGRDETELERLDRNWTDLLQELRVVQTGVQLLTGFLLTLPFQNRFVLLESYQRTTYLATVACAIGATGFLIAPVSLHRLLFRRQQRARMVGAAHVFALIGMVLLGCAVTGVVLLTFSLVTSEAGGLIAAGISAALLIVLWVLVPLKMRNLHSSQAPQAAPTP